MALDILVLLIIVVLIFQRLWRVLGSEGDAPNRIKLSKEGAEKLYNLLKKESEKELGSIISATEELEPIENKPLTELEQTLLTIPGFDRDNFIKGAKKAFTYITAAFNQGDVATLKILVAPAIYQKMSDIIQQRQAQKITAETDFIGFDKSEIVKAVIDGDNALVTVEFVSEQVNVLRSESGEIIEGDENYIQNITDIWTFSRPLQTKDSNWLLISTKK